MNILLLGKPGTGKGTISQALLDNPNFVQLSTGDLLRAEAEKDTPLGNKIRELTKTSRFATDDDIFQLVEKFLEENANKSIIFDGFPRNVSQLQYCLDNGIQFDAIYLLEVANDNILVDRVVNRRIHKPSGRIYNIKNNPPKIEGLDDITGEPLTQRHDDRAEILQERFDLFYVNTQPMFNELDKRNISFVKIDADLPLEDQLNVIHSTLPQPTTPKKLKI